MTNFKSISSRARALGLASATLLATAGLFQTNVALAASATAGSSATVVEPIAITKTADLVFGKFSAGTGGTVVVDTDGARTVTGGVVLLTGTGGAAASFNVTGDADATYAITLPSGTEALTRDAGSETMDAGTWVSSPAATGTLTAGAQTVTVGATLTVASAQVAGTYNGTFAVTVEYN